MFWISRNNRGSYNVHHIEPKYLCYIGWQPESDDEDNLGMSICPDAGKMVAPDLKPRQCQELHIKLGDTYDWVD